MRVLDNILEAAELARDFLSETFDIALVVANALYQVLLVGATSLSQETGLFADSPEFIVYALIIGVAIIWRL